MWINRIRRVVKSEAVYAGLKPTLIGQDCPLRPIERFQPATSADAAAESCLNPILHSAVSLLLETAPFPLTCDVKMSDSF